MLREHAILDPTSPDDRVMAGEMTRRPDHQLLVNWFRIHLAELERILPRLTVRFLTPTSPFDPRKDDGLPFVYDRVQLDPEDANPVGFTPDGVFSIHDSEEGKALLFFLEVDMGTEPQTSPSGVSRNPRDKILRYQAYFRQKGYKRYEKMWECSLGGFRLLFLTNTPTRMAKIGRLVQDTPPGGFVWVTDQERIFRQGLADAIWTRGGHLEKPPESILGPEMRRPSALQIKD